MSGQRKRRKKGISGKTGELPLPDEIHEGLLLRAKANFPEKDFLLTTSHDGVKMSDVLAKFVEPYQETAENGDEYKRLLMLAMAAWNTALFPQKERKHFLKMAAASFPPGEHHTNMPLMLALVERKIRFFPQYKRMLLDFEVTETADHRHISVISSPCGFMPSGRKCLFPLQKAGGLLARFSTRISGWVRDLLGLRKKTEHGSKQG